MEKQRYYLIGISVSFISVVVLFIALIISLYVSMQKYSTQLENNYKSNLYQLVQNVDDLQVDMSKLIATSSKESQREILTNMRTSCTLAVGNLSVLPIASNKVESVNNFFNMVSGFSQSLIDKINNDKEIEDEEYSNIEKLFDKCTIFLYDMNEFVSKASFDYSILKDIDLSNENDSSFTAGVANGNNPESDMPTLIFDGPFAESVVAKEVKGLPEIVLTREECEERLDGILEYYSGYQVEYVGESNGELETYNFNLKNESHTLYTQITKRGGMLLNITSYGDGGKLKLSEGECREIVLNTAQLFGFENMQIVWGMENGNIFYFNLAPVVDDVIYYSDLIKVKIDKRLGVVIGWDSVNYAYNHVDRGLFKSKVGIVECSNKLNPLLTVKSMKKSLIPNKYSGEVFAYEYVCEWNDYTYYIYLDSQSGNELKIMRLISTNTGALLMW